jgi:hypothetical protein
MLLVSEVTRAPQNGHEFQYLVHITSTVLVFSSYLVRLECFITNVFVYHHECCLSSSSGVRFGEKTKLDKRIRQRYVRKPKLPKLLLVLATKII